MQLREKKYLEQLSKEELIERILIFFDRIQTSVPEDIESIGMYKNYLLQPFVMKHIENREN